MQFLEDAVRVLLVEDRETVAVPYLQALRNAGFDARLARDATDALRTAATWRPHLVAAQVRLPGPRDGLALTGQLRGLQRRFKILLGVPYDKQSALLVMEAGADLWYGEDWGADLFVKLVEALLFPPSDGWALLTGRFRYPGFTILLAHPPEESRLVLDNGKSVALTPNEVLLVGRLLKTPGQDVTVEELARAVWKQPGVDDPRHNMVTSALWRLRQKLAAAGADSIIRVKRGRFFITVPESEADAAPRAA